MKFNLKDNTVIITEETKMVDGVKKVFVVATCNVLTKKFKLHKEALHGYFDELYEEQSYKIGCCLTTKSGEETLLSYVEGYELALTFERWVLMFYNKEKLIGYLNYCDFNSSYPKALLNSAFGKATLSTIYGEFRKVKKGE